MTGHSPLQSLSAAALPYLEDYNGDGRLNASISKRRSTEETIAVQRRRYYTRMARRFQDHPVYQFLIMSSIVLVLFLSDADIASNAGQNESAHRPTPPHVSFSSNLHDSLQITSLQEWWTVFSSR